MSALDDHMTIVQLVFKLHQVTGEKMVLQVSTEFAYSVTIPDRKLSFTWNTAADAMAFLSSLDGNPKQIADRVKQAKVDALNARIAEDQAKLTELARV